MKDHWAAISPIEEIIEAARNGQMFILVDDEDRENEGDLVIPAQMATPAAINFMAMHGRGLICLALPKSRVEKLGLPFMSPANGTRHQTAFTISIEAREGVTTGISAPDRARTISVAIDPAKNAGDLVSPGHVFPLMARDGGVLVRAGHTEAAVDVARLAGLNPAGVICEIMNDDGTMARMDQLVGYARQHGLKIGTIADLIAYRRRYDKIVERSLETSLHSLHGGVWRMIVYKNQVGSAEHIALIKGDPTSSEPVLTRVHALHVLDDVLGEQRSGKGGELQQAMRMIAAAGRGVVIVLREANPTSLSERIQSLQDGSDSGSDLRDYGMGAQILLDLGVREMILLSNRKRTIIGLEGYGLSVVEQRAIPLVNEEEIL